jgi:acetylornithine deacetylase/succinyl-diaminopimelate desuccinylase-like protein
MQPGAVPIPMLIPGITDARFFSRLGIQTYGFIPMNLPTAFDFGELVHAADERIPESCLGFGMSALENVVLRMGEQEI